jgi:hypothetical protein
MDRDASLAIPQVRKQSSAAHMVRQDSLIGPGRDRTYLADKAIGWDGVVAAALDADAEVHCGVGGH